MGTRCSEAVVSHGSASLSGLFLPHCSISSTVQKISVKIVRVL